MMSVLSPRENNQNNLNNQNNTRNEISMNKINTFVRLQSNLKLK